MNNYVINRVSLSEMLKRDDYSFAFKGNEGYNLYTESIVGNELCILKNEMGKHCDDLLFIFLKEMKPIYKYILSNRTDSIINIINIMLMFLKINYGNIKSGGFSFCSHAQGFFSFFKNRGQIESYMENEYKKKKPLLDYCFYYSKNEIHNNGRIYSILKNNIEKLKRLSEKMISDNKINFLENSDTSGKLDESHFHRLLYKNTNFIKKIECDLNFKKKRFLTICFYYFLRSTGVDYRKRCYFAYIIYRHIETYYGFTYNGLLENAKSSSQV